MTARKTSKQKTWRIAGPLSVLVGLLLSSLGALATTYVYDGSGRLAAVSDDNGASARYAYDSIGNLLAVDRFAAGQLAIFTFSPGRGAPGTTVRIKGQGFSATATQNAVKFNGVAATVSAATATELTVAVPSGATTGPISITVATVTANSVANFIVDAAAAGPVITSVAPTLRAVGDSVTTTGTSLLPVAGQTSTWLNGRPVSPATSSNTKIIFPVPANVGSGKVTVTTPYGSATSSQDVVVVPPGIATTDIESSKRLALNAAAQTLTVNGSEKSIAVIYDVAAGDYPSLQFSALGALSVAYTVYGPANALVASGAASASNPTGHLPRAAVGGTYLVLLRPSEVPATWKLAVEKAAILAVGGATLTQPVAGTAQSKRTVFTATTGQNLGLGLSDSATPNASSSSYFYLQVFGPDGSYVASQYCYAAYNGCQVNLFALAAGTYSVVASPPSDGDQTMSFKSTLSADITATLALNTAKSVSVARLGQNARLSFSGTAGQTVALRVSGQSTTPSDRDVYYQVYAPDGSYLNSVSVRTDGTLNLPNLPATGTYTVLADPSYGETMNATVLLSSGVTGTAPISGATGSYATTVAGQNVYLSFTATAGQNLGLGLSDLVTPNATSPLYLQVVAPDGSNLVGQYCYVANDGCQANLPNLVAGTYSVVVSPPSDGDQTMRFKSTLSADLTGSLTINTARTVSVTRRGQNARLSFSGTAGQTVALRVSEQSTQPADRDVYYWVYAPDGSQLSNLSVRTDGTVNLPNLPATGTYVVLVDSYYGETVSSTLLLSSGVSGTAPIGGATGSYATTVPGQNVYLSFTATAGQNLGLGLSDLVTPNATSGMYLQVLGPDGGALVNQNCYVVNNGCQVNLSNLAAGTYSVVVSPPYDGDQTMSFKSTLSVDLTASLALNTAKSVSVTRRGQNARLSFSGTAGQTVALRISGQTTGPADRDVYYRAYAPDGSQLDSLSVHTDGTLNLSNLPATGTYVVFVDSYYGETVSSTVRLSTGVTGTAPVGGAIGSYATTVPGQNVYLSFTATAGQNLGLGLSELATPNTTSPVYLLVSGPDGGFPASQYCYADNGGCQVNLSDLAAGTYSVMVSPPTDGAQTMSFKSTLSVDLTGSLAIDTANAVSVTRRGQNARLGFSGSAGQTLALRVSGQSTGPAERDVYYRVYAPDGSYLNSLSVRTDGTLNLSNLPATGAYMVFVDSYYGETVSSTVLLSSGVTGTAAVGGATGSYATTVPGQNVYLSFTATAGQNLGLGLSELLTPNSASYLYLQVLDSSGGYIASQSCSAADGGCQVNLPGLAAGVYSVVVSPPSDGNQTMSFKSTLSADLTDSLTVNTAKVVSVARRGQNARLSFSRTAGQTVALRISGQTTGPADRDVYYRVYAPDGSQLSSMAIRTDGTLNLPNLPATGAYVVFVDSYYGETLSSTVLVSSGLTGTMPVGGATGSYATTMPGQNAYLSFTATAGQNLGLGLSDLATPNTTSALYVQVLAADGSYVTAQSCAATDGGCQVNLPGLAAGLYSVVVSPPSDGAQTMSFKTTLSADLTGTLAMNTAKAVSVTRRGQNARLSFSGTAGQTLALRISGQSTGPADRDVYYWVYAPDGAYLNSVVTRTEGTLNLPDLPATGTYQVLVDPYYGETVNSQVLLGPGN